MPTPVIPCAGVRIGTVLLLLSVAGIAKSSVWVELFAHSCVYYVVVTIVHTSLTEQGI